jgi:amino-acid N-acetyltransferase
MSPHPGDQPMSVPDLTLRRADEAELDYIERLLARNDLPTADVRAKPDCFHIALADGERVGVGGIEPHGSDGLLRSVVVQRAAHGRGLGGALCEALAGVAREEGVGTLYLLTTDAADFFAHHGFARVERDAVPEQIRGTPQFDDLCPASAAVMRRSLSPGSPTL